MSLGEASRLGRLFFSLPRVAMRPLTACNTARTATLTARFSQLARSTITRPPSSRLSTSRMSTKAPTSVVGLYSQYLHSHPLTTKVMTAGLIGIIADLTAQLAIERATQLDIQRLAKFVALQMVIIAPVLHVWYGVLNRRLPGNNVRVVLQRVALDQLAFAPPFLAFFLATLSLLEGRGDRIAQQMQNDWLPTVIKNWELWVPAQLINFRFVGPAYQVLFSNIVGLFWTVYLSVVAHHDDADGSGDEK